MTPLLALLLLRLVLIATVDNDAPPPAPPPAPAGAPVPVAASPLALHRSMEIEDLDREIERQHDAVQLMRTQHAASQRLAGRGLVSRAEIERESADLRLHQAREIETIAYRALKVYERDVLRRAIAPDDRKASDLLLDWVKKQGAIAQVDADYRTYTYRQAQALHQRNAVAKEELETAELDYDNAQAGLALNQARVAEVLLERASRAAKPPDPAEKHRLEADYLRARVRYCEMTSTVTSRRLEVARELLRLGHRSAEEIAPLERAASDAAAALAVARRALAEHDGRGQ